MPKSIKGLVAAIEEAKSRLFQITRNDQKKAAGLIVQFEQAVKALKQVRRAKKQAKVIDDQIKVVRKRYEKATTFVYESHWHYAERARIQKIEDDYAAAQAQYAKLRAAVAHVKPMGPPSHVLEWYSQKV